MARCVPLDAGKGKGDATTPASGITIKSGHTVQDFDFQSTCLLVKGETGAKWVLSEAIFGADGIKSVLRKAQFDGEHVEDHGRLEGYSNCSIL